MTKNKPRTIRLPDESWNDLKTLAESETPVLKRWQMMCKLISEKSKSTKPTKRIFNK